jgi:diaminopimelate epimerase
MTFYRCSATKNTFFFITESMLGQLPPSHSLFSLSRPELANKVCDSIGSGADGLVIVTESPADSDLDFRWDFYNRDGSSAEMCGNAARCMGYFAENILKMPQSMISFLTLSGPVKVRINGQNGYSVHMPDYKIINWAQTEVLNGQKYSYHFINTGVPHIVIEVPSIELDKLNPVAVHFRNKPELGPGGSNVSFYVRNREGVKAITFERGVEGFTASCGTGVVAVALAAMQETGKNETGLSTV